MIEDEIRPRDCPHCALQDGRWSMVDAALHFQEDHPKYLETLKSAVALHYASTFGMEPWNG